MTRPSGESPKAILALSAASLLWGASFIAMKGAMLAYSPMLIVFARMALGAALMLWLLRREGGAVPLRKDIKIFAFMTLCEPCLYFTLEANALQYTQAAQAGMVTAMLPLMVTAAAAVILKERMGARGVAGLVLAVAGVILLSLAAEETQSAPNPLLGNFLEFLAMVCAAGYILAAKVLGRRYSPLYLTTAQACAGAVFFSPALLFSPAPERFPLVPSLCIVFLAVGVTYTAYVLYNYGVSKVDASRASVFINLIPVITVILSWIFLGERLFPAQYAGAAVVFLGVYLSAKPSGSSRQSTRGE